MRDYLRDKFLLELRNVQKFYADAGVLESIDRLAAERQTVFVRKLDLETELIAGIDILFPIRKTPADADLLQQRILSFSVFRDEDRRNIQRESYVFSLID